MFTVLKMRRKKIERVRKTAVLALMEQSHMVNKKRKKTW